MTSTKTYCAFVGDKRVAAGNLNDMLRSAKEWVDREGDANALLIFEDQTGRQIDFDFRGSVDEVLARVAPEPARPGRPKLGVISREVSLLPDDWEWLEEQPNGISAALRRLVAEARKRAPDEHRARRAREAVSRFLTVMAGNRPNYEEASRALFANDHERFKQLVKKWP